MAKVYDIKLAVPNTVLDSGPFYILRLIFLALLVANQVPVSVTVATIMTVNDQAHALVLPHCPTSPSFAIDAACPVFVSTPWCAPYHADDCFWPTLHGRSRPWLRKGGYGVQDYAMPELHPQGRRLVSLR
jgi:hypothetical protein